MAVPIVSEMRTTVRDRTVTNSTLNQPITDVEILRELNEAYTDIWEYFGLSTTQAAHATLWTPSPPVAGNFVFAGQVANIKEILRVFRSTTAGSVGVTAADFELDRIELTEMMYRRRVSDLYADPQCYALERPDAAGVAADVGKIRLHLWPDIGTTVYYLPAHYVKTKTALSADSDSPDVPELLARDISLIAAARLCPAASRTDDVYASIVSDISERTRNAMEGATRAWLEPKRRPGEATT
jgi:hypothetical protein